ncbi:MAG: hypothetical protein ACM3Q1_10495 [Bacteroidales bacterium]
MNKSLSEHFTSVLADVVPRVAGLCDRDQNSRTYGCCDRTYWHYKLIDLSNARYQEAGQLFALAYVTEAPGNLFHGVPAAAQWARAAWNFWLKRRNKDGSVVELYPNERCFCATSFSTSAFLETVFLLGGAADWQAELAAAEKTLHWLASHANNAPANQMAASTHALAAFARLTGDARMRQTAERRLAEFLALEVDGAFPEYGGFDAGYQSITLSTMRRIDVHLGGDEALRQSMRRAAERIDAAIDAEGRMDSAANSRGTQYLYPSALVGLKDEVLARLARGLDANHVLRPAWMDDRFCIAMATDYLMAARELASC